MSKQYIYSFALTTLITVSGCTGAAPKKNPFQEYLQTLPDIELPFETDSRIELAGRVKYDTAFRKFNPMQTPVYGKKQINDSIFSILFLEPGDMVYPTLVTYTAQGEKIDAELLLHLPGGGLGYDQNGLSYLHFDKNFQITITDSTNTFTRDSSENIIPERTVKSTEITRFRVLPDGQIQEQKP